MARFYSFFGVVMLLLVAATAQATPRETYGEARRFMKEEKWASALERFQSLDYVLLEDYVLFDRAAC